MHIQKPTCQWRVLPNALPSLTSRLGALLVVFPRVTKATVTVAGKIVRHAASFDAPTMASSRLTDRAQLTFYRTPHLKRHAA